MLKKTKFKTVFANDILNEAEVAWTIYMSRFGYQPEMYHNISIVDLVKMHKQGADIFPKNIEVVTGEFPFLTLGRDLFAQGFETVQRVGERFVLLGEVQAD